MNLHSHVINFNFNAHIYIYIYIFGCKMARAMSNKLNHCPLRIMWFEHCMGH